MKPKFHEPPMFQAVSVDIGAGDIQAIRFAIGNGDVERTLAA